MKKIDKISKSELKAKGVSALADRPNQTGQYGRGGMSAQQLKASFDNLSVLLGGKLNEIISAMQDAGYIGVKAKGLVEGEDELSLADVIDAFRSDRMANYMLAFPSVSSEELKTIQSIFNGIAKDVAELKTLAFTSFKIHCCTSDEYNKNLIPVVDNPVQGTLYLVPENFDNNVNKYAEWYYWGNSWEKWGNSSVSIANILQTESSMEDGGENKIVVYLSDGTTRTFNVRNGTRGESIFDIAKKNGYAGTESDFLQSLKGSKGENGSTPTVTIGDITTGEAGTPAFVENIGDAQNIVLNFTLPRGDQGQQGQQGNAGRTGAPGEAGRAAKVRVGTITIIGENETAYVTNTGTETDAILNFYIPRGATGPQGNAGTQGPKGATGAPGVDGRSFSPIGTVSRIEDLPVKAAAGTAYFVGSQPPRLVYVWDAETDGWINQGYLQGPSGDAASVSIGEVLTGAEGTNAIVQNVGTDKNVVLKFVIPRGATGAPGAIGPVGQTGEAGADGRAATITIKEVRTGAAGTAASVINEGSETDLELVLTLPKGDKGDKGEKGESGSVGFYGTCATIGENILKEVSCSGFSLRVGVQITVKFDNEQSYDGQPMLNVNNTGAKNIECKCDTAAGKGCWQAGEVVSFAYDGTNYVMIGGGNADETHYGKVILSSSLQNDNPKVAASAAAVHALNQMIGDVEALMAKINTGDGV